MRRSTRALAALAVAVTALGLAAPAQAGTSPVLAFTSSPSPAFGSVAVGSSLDRTFTLTNTGGSASAAITASVAPTGAFTIPTGGNKCTGVSLGPKKTCTITVRYTPAAAGASDSATLTASAKKPTQPAVLTLTGSSPTALSTGCADIQSNGYADEVPPLELMNAGETVTLTVPGTGGSGSMFVYPTDGTPDLQTPRAFYPDVATYTIPTDGFYRWGFSVSADVPPLTWYWSCSAA